MKKIAIFSSPYHDEINMKLYVLLWKETFSGKAYERKTFIDGSTARPLECSGLPCGCQKTTLLLH